MQVQAVRKKKKEEKVTWDSLWEHEVALLYEEMEKDGLIPLVGDSKYFWPAMVLRVNRLLYERLNNGLMNYYAEKDEEDWFYKRMERELNEFGRIFGLGDFGTALVRGSPHKVLALLNTFVRLVKKRRYEWKLIRWKPAY